MYHGRLLGKVVGDNYVFFNDGSDKKMLQNCSDCMYNHYVRFPDVPFFSAVHSCCTRSNLIISVCYVLDRDFDLYTSSKRYISIPDWCPFHRNTLSELPLSDVSWEILEDIVSRLAFLHRYSAIKETEFTKGITLIIEGEITPEIKELFLEVLI